MGKQLQSLLANDFSTVKGRNAAQKNAFALIRLQRYKVSLLSLTALVGEYTVCLPPCILLYA